MRIKFLDVNTRYVIDRARLCVHICIILFFLEGALRKWVLPGMTNVIPIMHDPFLLYVLIVGIRYNLINNWIAIGLMATSAISAFAAIVAGHHNVIVAIYGARIYFMYLPCIFIIGKILQPKDINFILKEFMFIFPPMFILMLAQYFSPQSSWVNMGATGGDIMVGTGDFLRIQGTFSVTLHLACYLLLFFNLLLYRLSFRNFNRGIKKWLVYLFSISILISVAFLISRSAISLFAISIGLYLIFSRKTFGNLLLYVLIVFALFKFSQTEYGKTAIDNIMTRFEEAAEAEGDFIEGSVQNRVFDSHIRAFKDTQNFTGKPIPFVFGFGIGYGTRVGEKLLNLHAADIDNPIHLAEEEASREVCENGYIGGFFIHSLKLLLIISMFWGILINRKFKILSLFVIYAHLLFNANLGVPTTILIVSLLGGIMYHLYNNYSLYDYKHRIFRR